MTVRQLSRNKTAYVGVSGDTKPTNAPEGSTFYETDTDATYVFIGAAWIQEAALSGGGTSVVSGTVAVSSIAAGAARIGKVTVRNAADDADINPLAESTFTARLGEVQASPTANTVLDRLKALLTGIVLAAGANRIGKVTIRNAADSADINPLAVNSYLIECLGVQQRTVSNSAVNITATSIPANTKRATIYVGGTAGQAVRVGNAATVPTASTGLKVLVGDYIDLSDPAMDASTLLADLRFIRADAADITLDVIYWS